MDGLAPEILDNVLELVPEDEKKATFQSLSLVNKYFRDLANRKKYSKVNLALGRVIDDGNPGGHRYFENTTSQTFKFLQLIQESVDIAPHIRTLAFSVVDIDSKQSDEHFPEGYVHYKPFASIPIIISMAHNLQSISFPATRYDQAADWNLDIHPELRDAFIRFYSQRGPTLKSKVDITGIKNFPKELLCDIPDIVELCARPLLVSDAPSTSNNVTTGQIGVVPDRSRVLKLRALGLEVPWGLGNSWEQFIQLFRPPSSFADLSRLETLNVSYYESNLLEIDKLLRPCAATLKHIYLRVGSLNNGTTSCVNVVTNEMMDNFTTGVPDFRCLRNLRTLTIVGLVYNVGQYTSEYKTQAHWIANLLASLIQSPAYTTTLREIHFCFTIGHFPDSLIRSINWSPITDVLEQNFTQSRLEQISFNFRVRGRFGDTKHMSQGLQQDICNNTQIRALMNRTGIVVVKSDLAFSA